MEDLLRRASALVTTCLLLASVACSATAATESATPTAMATVSMTATPEASPTPVPTVAQPTATPLVVPAALRKGQALFASTGCAECHGANLEFLYPVNIKEVTPQAVTRWVRNPMGMMRSFPESTLPEAALAEIVEFVAFVLSERQR